MHPVLAGLGFAFMPQYSVTLPGLMTRPLVDPPVERTLVAAEVRGRKRSPVAKLFFEALHVYAWEHDRAPARDLTPV